MRVWLLAAIVVAYSCGADAAAVASGRNWQISIHSLGCEVGHSLLTVGTRIRYHGPKGPVEAPVIQLAGADGGRQAPKSLLWKSASKPLAEWLAAGGLHNLQSEDIGEVQLKFEVREASGVLSLEFGDIGAFALTRLGGRGVCASLLKLDQIQAPRIARPAGARGPKIDFPIQRNRYLCTQAGGTVRTTEADYPPYLPRQLLLFGRGYLPSARQVDLPMGKAPAQPYSYTGPDELRVVEYAARVAVTSDFPDLAAGKFFGFNWGAQKGASGNELYSIGIYDLRRCPK